MSKRLAYRHDGTTGFSVVTDFTSGNQTAISDANDDILNGDATQAASYLELITSANVFSGVLFHLAKAAFIDKIFVGFRYNSVTGTPATTLLFEASADSTDGSDGTWVTLFTESHTVRAADSDSRLFLKAQTSQEASTTYTWIRMSWSGHADLNNLRVNCFWIYGDYSSPPYEFYDAQGLKVVKTGEVLLGTFSGDVAHTRDFKFKIKNTEGSSRTYTIAFSKVKAVADASFVANCGVNTDGANGLNTSVAITVAAGEFGEFYLATNIPKNGDSNGNAQDNTVHYGKLTVTAAGVTDLPALFFAVHYGTLAQVEALIGIGVVNLCLVYQRDQTDEGLVTAWSLWDAYGVASVVEQEAVGNDIVLLQDSSGFVWEMDRGEFDNEEFVPTPIVMVIRTVDLPARQDPHVHRRSLWLDFDVTGADGGIIADHILIAKQETGENKTTQRLQVANPNMRIASVDVGTRFQHELRFFTGGELAITNYGFYYQNLTERGRLPYVA